MYIPRAGSFNKRNVKPVAQSYGNAIPWWRKGALAQGRGGLVFGWTRRGLHQAAGGGGGMS